MLDRTPPEHDDNPVDGEPPQDTDAGGETEAGRLSAPAPDADAPVHEELGSE